MRLCPGIRQKLNHIGEPVTQSTKNLKLQAFPLSPRSVPVTLSGDGLVNRPSAAFFLITTVWMPLFYLMSKEPSL